MPEAFGDRYPPAVAHAFGDRRPPPVGHAFDSQKSGALMPSIGQERIKRGVFFGVRNRLLSRNPCKHIVLGALRFLSRPSESQSGVNWLAQVARDAGKPVPDKTRLSSIEGTELAKLRPENRELQRERNLPAKRTTWLAGPSEGSPANSSHS